MNILLILASFATAQAAQTITLFEGSDYYATNEGRFDHELARECTASEMQKLVVSSEKKALDECKTAGFKNCLVESRNTSTEISEMMDCDDLIKTGSCRANVKVQGSNDSDFTKAWTRKKDFRVETPRFDIGDEYDCNGGVTGHLLKEVRTEAENTCVADGFTADMCVISFVNVYRETVWTGPQAFDRKNVCYGYALVHGFSK